MHPLSREKRGIHEMMRQSWGFEPSGFREETFFKKKLRKSFVSSKIVLTFASAFGKEAFEEEFFERFRYEQASSTSLT